MKRKVKESKLNVFLTAMLVVFVCLLSFSVGVISGKGWSDRDYKVKHIEQDSHLKMAQEDDAPIGEDMSEKEVELLTQKALEEAKAEDPAIAAAAEAAATMATGKKPAGVAVAPTPTDDDNEANQPLVKSKDAKSTTAPSP